MDVEVDQSRIAYQPSIVHINSAAELQWLMAFSTYPLEYIPRLQKAIVRQRTDGTAASKSMVGFVNSVSAGTASIYLIYRPLNHPTFSTQRAIPLLRFCIFLFTFNVYNVYLLISTFKLH